MHLLWVTLMVTIYVALWIARELTTSFGAPGLQFFRFVMYLNAAFISLLGISYFSSVISEEKEEDTLGLMTMAGISTLGILLGKSTSRLFQVALLLAIQYPFTLLAVTMGGLLPTQIASAYTSLLAYTILLANVGLFCSVACRTNRNASGLTTLWFIGYLFSPLVAFFGYEYLRLERSWSNDDPVQNAVLSTLDWIAHATIVFDLYQATETGYQFTWSPQIVGNTLGGIACFLLAWRWFGFVAKEPVQETASRGIVARRTNRVFWMLSAGRAWRRPLVWKDFYFVSGGWSGLLIRTALYAGVYGLCYLSHQSMVYRWNGSINWNEITEAFQFCAHPLLVIDLALSASRVFQEEIRGQTLSSLLMLPRPVISTIYGKMAGCALGSIPGALALLISLKMPGGSRVFSYELRDPTFLWWIMNLIALIHLSAVYSIFLRSGALALALGTIIGTMTATGVLLAFLLRGGDGPGKILMWTAAIFLGMISLACHGIILWRVPALGQT